MFQAVSDMQRTHDEHNQQHDQRIMLPSQP